MKQGDGVTKASEGKQQQQQQPAAAEPEREPTKEELEAEFDPNDAGASAVIAHHLCTWNGGLDEKDSQPSPLGGC
uniref:Uncharacterized protein n=1 Tax=Anopheles albimanus TaxID=7167 RepID=A0A182FUX5_ANOAL